MAAMKEVSLVGIRYTIKRSCSVTYGGPQVSSLSHMCVYALVYRIGRPYHGQLTEPKVPVYLL